VRQVERVVEAEAMQGLDAGIGFIDYPWSTREP
jgi:hypothetical protein